MFTKKEMLDYVNQLAEGIDPKTGEVLENDSILNRGDVVRLFYALKDYLSKEQEQSKEEIKEVKKKISKNPFKLSTTVGIVGNKTAISKFVKIINEFRDEDTKPLKYTIVVDWLLKEEYLFINNSNLKEPTEKGKNVGIEYNLKFGSNGKMYYVVEYNSNAQQFILDNLLNGNIN